MDMLKPFPIINLDETMRTLTSSLNRHAKTDLTQLKWIADALNQTFPRYLWTIHPDSISPLRVERIS